MVTYFGRAEKLTYKFDAVARGGGQGPAAGLLAGILVRPVRAADGA